MYPHKMCVLDKSLNRFIISCVCKTSGWVRERETHTIVRTTSMLVYPCFQRSNVLRLCANYQYIHMDGGADGTSSTLPRYISTAHRIGSCQLPFGIQLRSTDDAPSTMLYTIFHELFLRWWFLKLCASEYLITFLFSIWNAKFEQKIISDYYSIKNAFFPQFFWFY